MVDEQKDIVAEEKPAGKIEQIKAKFEAFKIQAAAKKQAMVAKYNELKEKYLILEKRARVQTRLLTDKVVQSEAAAISKSAYQSTANYVKAVKIVPKKKIVDTAENILYGYVEMRNGSCVSMSEVAIIERTDVQGLISMKTDIVDILNGQDENVELCKVEGVHVFTGVLGIYEVSEKGIAKLESKM